MKRSKSVIADLVVGGVRRIKPAAAPKVEKLTPLFDGTKLEPGKTYRLPQKRGSRGKGTRLG